jgi:glycosyltransferase involved in cell wall biosynthesis
MAIHSVTVASVFDLHPAKYGSMEEYAVFLSRALAQRDWQSFLVFSGPPDASVAKDLEAVGAQSTAFARGSKFTVYSDLFRRLRRPQVDILHVHFFEYFSLLPFLLLLRQPKLLVFTDHYRQPQPISVFTKAACYLWDRLLFRFSGTRIVAISEHIQRTLVDCYKMAPERIRVIYNGVNLARFAPVEMAEIPRLRAQLGLPAEGPWIVCASNLRPEKGISDLLVAARTVSARRADALFVILGEGPMLPRLQQETQHLGIGRRVRFLGLRSDVHRFMAAADVVAVPSIWQEPAGLVVVEGMAVGRPVVATRVGGIPEYLEDGVTGILVEPRSPEQLAQAILRLLDAPDEAAAMGRAGRKRVEEQFSMEGWVEDTIQLYDRALGEK